MPYVPESTDPDARRIRLLLADDDDALRGVVSAVLRREGYEVLECRNGTELLEMLAPANPTAPHGGPFDVVVSDVSMPGATGLDVLERMSAVAAAPSFILVTGESDKTTRDRALARGAEVVLDKPFELAALVRQVRLIVNRRRSHPTGPHTHEPW